MQMIPQLCALQNYTNLTRRAVTSGTKR